MSTVKKSQAMSPFAWAVRNSAHVRPRSVEARASMPWRFRIAHTLEGAIGMPMVASSPWIRR